MQHVTGLEPEALIAQHRVGITDSPSRQQACTAHLLPAEHTRGVLDMPSHKQPPPLSGAPPAHLNGMRCACCSAPHSRVMVDMLNSRCTHQQLLGASMPARITRTLRNQPTWTQQRQWAPWRDAVLQTQSRPSVCTGPHPNDQPATPAVAASIRPPAKLLAKHCSSVGENPALPLQPLCHSESTRL